VAGFEARIQERKSKMRRFMRMMVFFDLPMITKAERRAYTLFRRFLLNDGYDMIQFSIYGRILNGHDAEDKHMKRLIAHLPPEGSVRVLTVTEKQFASMKMLVGLPLFQEKQVNSNQMLLF
jgi:CRISPR-associated protein Cas2